MQIKNRQVLEANIDSNYGTKNIVPTYKKIISPSKKLLDLLSSTRVLIRFLLHSPRYKTSFTIKLNFVIDAKGLPTEKNLLSYSQVLFENESEPGVYDPDNPASCQVLSITNSMKLIGLEFIKQKYSSLQKLNCSLTKIDTTDVLLNTVSNHNKMVYKVCNFQVLC